MEKQNCIVSTSALFMTGRHGWELGFNLREEVGYRGVQWEIIRKITHAVDVDNTHHKLVRRYCVCMLSVVNWAVVLRSTGEIKRLLYITRRMH